MALYTRVSTIHFTNGSPMHTVLEMIAAKPGTWLQNMADDLGVARENLQEYVRYASNEGWVRRLPKEGHRIPLELTEEGHDALADVQTSYGVDFKILNYVYTHPGCTANKVIRNLKADPVKPTARHIAVLIVDCLLEVEDERLYITSEGVQFMRDVLGI